jgi:hypothetical protein
LIRPACHRGAPGEGQHHEEYGKPSLPGHNYLHPGLIPAFLFDSGGGSIKLGARFLTHQRETARLPLSRACWSLRRVLGLAFGDRLPLHVPRRIGAAALQRWMSLPTRRCSMATA